MRRILFISPGENYLNRDEISCVFQHEGYDVQFTDLDSSTGKSAPELSGYELAVIHLHPEIPASWGMYLDLKHRFPQFPILVFMPHHAVHRLKSAVFNLAGRHDRMRMAE